MNPIGEQMTNDETAENEEESLLKNENSGGDDDTKINYRGWKVMPFIIGEQDCNGRLFCFYLRVSFIKYLVIHLRDCQEMRFLRS
jgi:hypothetical protein